ncbi:MAG: 7-carboxy-7-deazaguanine synthase QueE, partial [Acidobacteriota bacterium]
MFVAEVFASLQGEGILAGTPSLFIRTSGCNLRCRWCDTPYASWRPEGSRRTVRELAGAATAAGLRHVVVTGGEPVLQRELAALTESLAANGHHVTVETAGTLVRPFACGLLSVSPKTSNSDPDGPFAARHRFQREDLRPLRELLVRFPEHQLKFVVRDEGDLGEILDLVSRAGAARDRVVLMPEGRTAEAVAARAPLVGRMCRDHGLRYSPRLHLDLFGSGRGV